MEMQATISKPQTSLQDSLPLQLILAVGVGIALGAWLHAGELKPLTQIGKFVIHWVKLVAGPLLFLTIVAAILETEIAWAQGRKILWIAGVNMFCAFAIGLGLASLFSAKPSGAWVLPVQENAAAELAKPSAAPVSLESWLKGLSPASIFEPFVKNDILLIAILALLVGLALRKATASQPDGAETRARLVRGLLFYRKVPEFFLERLIAVIPLAVLTLIAGTVSEHGIGVLLSLGYYVLLLLLGFALQIFLVYGSWLFIYAKIPWRDFIVAAKRPVLYAVGVNSSLATLPLTLAALDKLGVSKRSASLGAGLATNLNNDGIILYEAMAVCFVASVMGIPLPPKEILIVVLTCIVTTLGITGIPEAGFISLSVVLTALGYPLDLLPLLLAVDWLIARGRSTVNVLADLTLSIALDAREQKAQ